MDVIFETQRGRPFSIEVGFFDTVLEIKEKVQKYQGIPIPSQTLVFNGKVLQDEKDVEFCEILQNSRIQLLLAPEPDKAQVNIEQSSPSKKIQLNVNIPSSRTSVPLEMDVNDTVSRLKEKIHEMEPVPVNRLVVQSSGAELQDHQSLRDCELTDNTEIDVNIRSSPTGSGTGSAGAASTGSKRLKLMVLPKCETKKIPVEVNASDNVRELRKELQKLHQRLHFHLPQEGYFFIYKQNVMDEDRSFRWHQVAQGDTIEIFNGSVTGGS
ncbi:polyubiquitin-like isoform X1 [Durio zibethinus]|uniref:Polyubiquitin-like isoform X1 n=1 Tax=Durio zibethinus TaxID=66656 RepID=A0A6P5WWR5_DURZI|nr:polyubiquitin-like isoform X1 [Durio zibethinus]